MSVLACARIGCDNIMCTRYSLMHGYICDECFEELVMSMKDVSDFMISDKPNDFVSDTEFRRQYLEREFDG